jgi:hypothetical protein
VKLTLHGDYEQVLRVYEIPGRGYGDDPASRVKVLSDHDWLVTLDISADEYYGSEQVIARAARHGNPRRPVRIC